MNKDISPENLSPIAHNQIPVITTELLAQLYGTEAINIQVNHTRNRDRFIEGKHFFKIEGAELKEFKDRLTDSKSVAKRARSLILWTERGAARHEKMLETDQAWEVFEKLEDCYFARKAVEIPKPAHPFIPQRFLLTLSDGAWFTEPAVVGSFIATPETLAQRIKAESYLFDRASLMQIMQTCLTLI